MILRSTLILSSLLAAALPAQTDAAEQKQSTGEGAFYKAFFLDKNDPKNAKATKQAITLYQSFLASHKDHKYTGRAAANCAVLLYSTGDVKAADAFAKEWSGPLSKVVDKAGANDPMSMLRGMGRGRGGDRPENPNQGTIDKLMGLLENADESKKARLSSAIRRLGGARELMMMRFRNMGGGGRGNFGGGRGRRGNRGGGFTKPQIAKMSKEDAKKAVESMVGVAERLVDNMAAQGQADAADKLEAKLDKIQDLVDDGKLEEAQKVIDSIEVPGGNRGRGGRNGQGRGGRRGGEQGQGGGQRRRGGGEQGQGGGERRRRGGE